MKYLLTTTEKIKKTYREFPLEFWILMGATFVDIVGKTLLFPFFALYITRKFNVGMTQVGPFFAIFAVSELVSSMLGGALADKFGRRVAILFGLVFSALSNLPMGLVNNLSAFYLLAAVAGLFSRIAFPARQAMIVDIVPEEKRTEGFGLFRIAQNLAWIAGPVIGGLLAAKSYLFLFVIDAITSLIAAAIVYKLLPETMPEVTVRRQQKTLLETLGEYQLVIKDKLYIIFLTIFMLMGIVYQQMYSTLSVYLRDVHSISEQGYGLLMAIGGVTVILFQFQIIGRINKFAPMLMMTLGCALYMVGFSMFGFVSTYSFFVVAKLIIVVGEMIVNPVSRTLTAHFAPVDMRGRYMAFFSISLTLPAVVGPWGAGLIMDNYDPNWVWYVGGLITAMAAIGFFALHPKIKFRFAAKNLE